MIVLLINALLLFLCNKLTYRISLCQVHPVHHSFRGGLQELSLTHPTLICLHHSDMISAIEVISMFMSLLSSVSVVMLVSVYVRLERKVGSLVEDSVNELQLLEP